MALRTGLKRLFDGAKAYILLDPDDNAQRETLAALLDGNGEPEYAEFIRIQLKLSEIPLTDKAARQPLKLRERELLEKPGNLNKWAELCFGEAARLIKANDFFFDEGNYFITPKFHRGLVEEITLPYISDPKTIPVIKKFNGIRILKLDDGNSLNPDHAISSSGGGDNFFTDGVSSKEFLEGLDYLSVPINRFSIEALLDRADDLKDLKVLRLATKLSEERAKRILAELPNTYIDPNHTQGEQHPKEVLDLIRAHNGSVRRENVDYYLNMELARKENEEITRVIEERNRPAATAAATTNIDTKTEPVEEKRKPGFWERNVGGSAGRTADWVARKIMGWDKPPPDGNTGR